MGSWSKNQPESIVLPCIRKYGCTDFYVLFCLAALIFRHWQNFSPRGFVFPDRADTLDRWQGPKSLRRTGLRSWYPVRPSSILQEERPLRCTSVVGRMLLPPFLKLLFLKSGHCILLSRIRTLSRILFTGCSFAQCETSLSVPIACLAWHNACWRM